VKTRSQNRTGLTQRRKRAGGGEKDEKRCDSGVTNSTSERRCFWGRNGPEQLQEVMENQWTKFKKSSIRIILKCLAELLDKR